MKLPNGDQAILPIEKLHDFCLDPNHPVGGHKAYVFMSVLGLTVKDADKLRQSLLAAACSENAVPGHYNQYGQRYTIDYELTTNSGTATVRSAWIIRTGETIPRLVSCYIR